MKSLFNYIWSLEARKQKKTKKGTSKLVCCRLLYLSLLMPSLNYCQHHQCPSPGFPRHVEAWISVLDLSIEKLKV